MKLISQTGSLKALIPKIRKNKVRVRGSSSDMLVNSHDRTKAVHIMPFSQVSQKMLNIRF